MRPEKFSSIFYFPEVLFPIKIISSDIKNVMLNSNKLELSVERSQQGLEQITAMQEETANNLTRLADRLDTFKVNTDQVEGKRVTDYLAAGASVLLFKVRSLLTY